MNNKKITHLEHSRGSHVVGDGFRVSQYIPGYGRDMNPSTSPFLMLDYNHPWKIEPQKDGYRPGVGFHPHRGFETVTIVYSGEIEHRDTAGHGGIIGADEVQWMTAGSGLLHNEFMTESFSRNGGIQHVVQLWVDLPKELKMTTPRYQALSRENIPEVVFAGGRVRVIAGTFEGVRGSAETYSPVELYDARFDDAGELHITLPHGHKTMILVTEGSVILNGTHLENGDMVHLGEEGSDIHIVSRGSSKILVMSGKPLGQTVVQNGPFVMNTEEEIMQAFADFQSGKMGKLD